MNILLAGVVGSTAYGLATVDSDVDRLGVFAAPTVEFHGLNPPVPTRTSTNPDVTFHEAQKYCKLALNGNPTIMELMWLNDYDTTTELGLQLIGIRKKFLSKERVREAYFGYATQQYTRLSNRQDNTFSSDTRKRTEKHARHLSRLLWQGFHLYTSGELYVRLPVATAESIKRLGEQVGAGDLTVAHQEIKTYEMLFDKYPSPLPDNPDVDKVEKWLLTVRRANL